MPVLFILFLWLSLYSSLVSYSGELQKSRYVYTYEEIMTFFSVSFSSLAYSSNFGA